MRSSGALSRMLGKLPDYFDRTPGTAAAVQLAPIAPITVQVAQHRFKTLVSHPSMVALDVDLLDYTLPDFVEFLQSQVGYGAGLLASDAGVTSAATLIDTEREIVSAGQLTHFTSLLWAVLSPIAWALDEAADRVRDGLKEFSVKTSDGLWLERWGRDIFGGIIRASGETDAAYAARVIREVTRWRVNGVAIEQILLEDLGVDATITALHDRAWVISRTGKDNAPLGYGYLAGRKYSRTTFEVVVNGISDQVAAVVERNRAAGTLPFYAYRSTGGGTSQGLVGAIGRRASHDAIGADTVWTVGRDPIGTSIALSGRIEVDFLLGKTIEESIFGGGGASAFILGTSPLGGADVLGEPGLGGMQIIEDYSECALI